MALDIPEVELEIISPLLECIEHCELCQRECCGIDAFDSRPVVVREWADAQPRAVRAVAVSQLEALIEITQDRSYRVTSDVLNHVTVDEPARIQLIQFFENFRHGSSGEPMAYELSTADQVWNRACGYEAWRGEGPPREGDEALAALLAVHNMVMNGGLGHAFDVLDADGIEAGIAAYRYFGLDDHANLLVCARSLSEPEQEELSPAYSRYGEDEVLAQAFEKSFEHRPEAFAPLN